ncbi:MAG: VOC family protein [Pseudomonadota bacterium]
MSAIYRTTSNFVWTDLSSYNTAASIKFYEAVFGWDSHDLGRVSSGSDDHFGMNQVTYHIAVLGDRPAAGIYDMPPFFKKIKMPPFWMSYVSVDGIEALVARARGIKGVSIDVEPTPFGDGMMALIRDPLGAGFTCYEGPSIDVKGDGGEYGRMVWNELITESIPAVEPFYRKVLGFDLKRDAEFFGNRVTLINLAGEEIAGIQEVDASIRSDKVYWMPFFSVDQVDEFNTRVKAAGGTQISTTDLGSGLNSALYFDDKGAAFGVAETGAEYRDVRPWYRKYF